MAYESSMIETRDGKTVNSDVAMTLSHRRLGAVVKALRGPMQNALSQVLHALGRNPIAFAVADVESEFAKNLTKRIGSVQVTLREGQALDPIWIPVPEAMARYEAAQTRRDDVDKERRVADDKAREVARQRIEAEDIEARKRAEQAAADAAMVEGLVPTDLRRPEARKDDDRREELSRRIVPWIQGQGRVNDPSRPSSLMLDGKRIDVVDFKRLVDQLDHLSGGSAEHLVLTCVFCDEQHALGETSIQRKKGEDPRVVYVVRQIRIGAMLPNGGPYLNMYDDASGRGLYRKGEPRQQPVAVCRRCASIATRLSGTVSDGKGGDKPRILPVDVLPRFKGFLANRGGTASRPSGDVPGTLVASADADGNVTVPAELTAPVDSGKGRGGKGRGGKGRHTSGPIGEVGGGASANPDRHDEGFVARAPEATSGLRATARGVEALAALRDAFPPSGDEAEGK